MLEPSETHQPAAGVINNGSTLTNSFRWLVFRSFLRRTGMDALFTPVSFILSVPDVDIVPNYTLKTRGADTMSSCLFPCFGACLWHSWATVLGLLLPPNSTSRETFQGSLPRTCCRVLALEAHPLMKQDDTFSRLSLSQQHEEGYSDCLSKKQCQKQEGTLKALWHWWQKAELWESINTLIFLCHSEERIDRAIFFNVGKSCLKISSLKFMCQCCLPKYIANKWYQ